MPTQPLITESQLLTSYLLTPSPFPTIIPYTIFLSLLPAPYRNNPDHHPSIKRLYRDLQFQRDITLSQVQTNIEAECGVRAAGLRASLARRIAGEEAEGTGRGRRRVKVRGRKRQRVEHGDHESSDHDEPSNIKSEDTYSSDDEFTDHIHLQTQLSLHNDPSRSHPATHTLPLPPHLLASRAKLEGPSGFHTKRSLLAAMEDGSSSLDREILELEGECERVKGDIKEVVGGLSDLRYGRGGRRKDGEVVGSEGEYQGILDALVQFRGVLEGDPEG